MSRPSILWLSRLFHPWNIEDRLFPFLLVLIRVLMDT